MKQIKSIWLSLLVFLLSLIIVDSLPVCTLMNGAVYLAGGTYTVSHTEAGKCQEAYAYTTKSEEALVLSFSSVNIDCTQSDTNLILRTNYNNETYTYCGTSTSTTFDFSTKISSYVAIQMYGIVSFSLGLQFSTNYVANCGVPAITPVISGESSRIVGGSTAVKNSWPWQVLFTNNAFICGGSIINNQWLVTAAHCDFTGTLYASLGDHNVFTADGETRVIVSRFIPHPTYATNNAYDIALLKLANPITFTNTISPVCLPQGKVTSTGQTAIVTGWGLTTEGGSTAADLQQVSVTIQADSVCSSDSSTDICAGDFTSPIHDSCQGDSGGPLVQKDTNSNSYYLAGVVSRGVGCRGRGVYTRVSVFEDWISSTIAANS